MNDRPRDLVPSGAPPPAGRRWRRKWRRASPQDRRAAAAALAHALRPAPARWATLLALLVLSVAAHAGLFCKFRDHVRGGRSATVAKATDTYLQKVLQRERAREVARNLVRKVTMPPPPADPAAVMAGTLTDSLVSDVKKITTGLLDVKLQSAMSAHVAASLKGELAEAAKRIAEGKLSEEEMQALHEQFRQKAHAEALAWQKTYREEKQVEIAALGTTEWYEERLSRTLVRNIAFELFPPPNYHAWPPSKDMWRNIFCGSDRNLSWGDLNSLEWLTKKTARLKELEQGLEGHGKNRHPSWPGPNEEQAKLLVDELTALHQGYGGDQHGERAAPSWRQTVYGGVDHFDTDWGRRDLYLTEGVIREYFPHLADEVRAVAGQIDEEWRAALASANEYLESASSSQADAAPRKEPQQACFAAMKRIRELSDKLVPPAWNRGWPGSPHRTINAILRAQVLCGPKREEMYQFWVQRLVAGLSPVVQEMVRAQFEKGIIVHKEGVEQAMQEFPKQIVPLLRRDVERILGQPTFEKIIFQAHYPYRTYEAAIPGEKRSEPGEKALQEDAALLEELLGRRPDLKAYAEARRKRIERLWKRSLVAVREHVLTQCLSGKLLLKDLASYVEGVEYADKVQEKLDARKRAMDGRGQDLAHLTADGVPDTCAPLVALMFGAAKGHGTSIEPVAASMQPGFIAGDRPQAAVRRTRPVMPPLPAKWEMATQAEARPPFKTPRCEAIPFLHRIPRLDGDLSRWGRLRPLLLKGGAAETMLYAAWNYQGFFFAYRVKQPARDFYYPAASQMKIEKLPNWGGKFDGSYSGRIWTEQAKGVAWACRGDYFRVLIDTLDARNRNRGEPHTQEFIIFPRGTESNPNSPGCERIIASQRDASVKEYRGVQSKLAVYPQQPPAEYGPDGSGPFRVTRMREDGYEVVVFLPRTLFNVPVFAPGWYIGFDCAVQAGFEGRTLRQHWASPASAVPPEQGGNEPEQWGDLLLLGTDARFFVQDVDPSGTLSRAIFPGHSYLLTVVDPDRNVNLTAEDTVLVSAESSGGDAEVYILRETDKNSGIFRGYVNTQPGGGREVQGVLECMPGEEIRFAYVDVADSRGARNVATEVRLPVVAQIVDAANGKQKRSE
jgi:hypothetical protein